MYSPEQLHAAHPVPKHLLHLTFFCGNPRCLFTYRPVRISGDVFALTQMSFLLWITTFILMSGIRCSSLFWVLLINFSPSSFTSCFFMLSLPRTLNLALI